jgi:tRNA uridine 5-carbamoylmethylation protein Kti12
MNILSSINELLSHIKQVEEETIQMSQDSMLMLSEFIEKNSIELDESAAKGLQYQDIISQQLTATIEAIASVQKAINIFENAYDSDEKIASNSIEKLHVKLSSTLQKAKDRKDAFSGKLGHADETDEIEFF